MFAADSVASAAVRSNFVEGIAGHKDPAAVHAAHKDSAVDTAAHKDSAAGPDDRMGYGEEGAENVDDGNKDAVKDATSTKDLN